MSESLLLLIIGLAAGLVCGVALSAVAAHYGIAFSSSEELLARWNLPARIYPQLNLFSLTIGPLIIFLVTSIAAWFPVLRVKRLHPVEAMRSV